MCGREAQLFLTRIDVTDLNVCNDCSKHGKVLRRIRPVQKVEKSNSSSREKEPKKEIVEKIIQGYGKIIKDAREGLKLKQEDFAKKINEKESFLQKIESSHHEPNIELAKKIEKFLGVKLVEEEKVEQVKIDHINSEALTIGDIIKLKE